MSKRSYPYKAWTLLPSFRPVEVEIVELAWNDWGSYAHWDQTAKGKTYDSTKLHATKDAAIAAGHIALNEQAKKLEQMAQKLEKRRLTLHEAAD